MNHSMIHMYDAFFSEHSCSILVYNRNNAHKLKIYEKYSKHIHCLKKYVSTQFQPNELQILYECSYNNPGMS